MNREEQRVKAFAFIKSKQGNDNRMQVISLTWSELEDYLIEHNSLQSNNKENRYDEEGEIVTTTLKELVAMEWGEMIKQRTRKEKAKTAKQLIKENKDLRTLADERLTQLDIEWKQIKSLKEDNERLANRKSCTCEDYQDEDERWRCGGCGDYVF